MSPAEEAKTSEPEVMSPAEEAKASEPEVDSSAKFGNSCMLDALAARGLREGWGETQSRMAIRGLVGLWLDLKPPAAPSPTVAPWKIGKAGRGEQFWVGAFLKM